ncbi:membrane-bound PQQ-dependent dehydrogenase, glucose/quinate/shikimate family [Pseudoxanthomonas composti]|uniref:Membrane-bound PQQ-dependent dehydrogenase, glucose/quinate/shikimate family n=1 Tax=Pseudoxanthomonas composti TaxID=2137479 RepID=A0A4Q1JWD4_9GAMM|nr:membrane-bound PQQ-dependent dehydrogenase, glucose/quinate/shikimate family [Pseudoxanthomonas composti]RXR06611.1 membrane-bound PQQ-dependent dehydrogenase, glucose/quinate/shikimate family [Pseudoxanthomonas composti]
MNASSAPRRGRWPLLAVGALVLLLGLYFTIAGGWLAALGGSWYYLPAGLGLVIAGVQLARGRSSGAWWYGAVFVLTVVWTAYESGLDYWRWVPRLGLILALMFVIALLLPRLDRGASRRLSFGIAAVLGVCFVVAFALAFKPYYVTAPDGPLPTSAGTTPTGDSASQAPGDWAAYGRGYDATRYSPLSQINKDNVGQLAKAWTYRTGDLPGYRWGAETTPLKVGDTIYLCTGRNVLIALDAASGKERWRFDPKVDEAAIPYTAACRGVSYYVVPAGAPATAAAPTPTSGEGMAAPASGPAQAAVASTASACRTRIIEGTLDGRVIAVDAATGKPCADFGRDGQVRITDDMGDTYPGMVSITSPPTIVQGVVVTGHQVLDGQYRYAPSGVIKGYDAVTGALRWAWDLARPEIDTRPPQGETYTRGTPNMWTTASGDEKLGYVYLPMGNSGADYFSGSRTEAENRYATSLVAIDVNTGKPVWNFQTTHIDVWDYDQGSQATLVDFPVGNGAVPALVLPTKQGDVYVLDRATGKPLVGVEERPAPGGGVEPDKRARTQPHSLYNTLAKAPLTERDMWGMTPIDQLVCRLQFKRASYEGMYTPPSAERHSIEYPGYNGGSDWGGIAVDTQRGIIVANYNDMPNYNQLVPRAEANKLGWLPRDQMKGKPKGSAEGAGDPQIGVPYAVDVNAGWRLAFTKLLCKQPPYGGIRAIALKTGKTLWDRPFGSARGNGPFGIRSGLPIEIGTPNNGGAAVTAGGLIFIAAATDDLIRAIDIETGETVWHDKLPAGGQATPMVYEVGGRQFLVIMAGGHHFLETPEGDYVVAYALPQGKGASAKP